MNRWTIVLLATVLLLAQSVFVEAAATTGNPASDTTSAPAPTTVVPPTTDAQPAGGTPPADAAPAVPTIAPSDGAVPAAAPAPSTAAVAPSATDPLGGYNVLIADRGNNRLLLVSPDKRILWEYDFAGLRPGHGADDAFFADNGKSITVNLEYGQLIEVIDRATKKVTWQYGHMGRRGHAPGYLDYPDDAYRLPNGNIVVADIRNCRIIEITPDHQIARQAGITGRCWRGPHTLGSPNGDKPLPNGDLLVSTINDHSLTELDKNWQPILKMSLPIHYPSDPQMTKAGNFLVASYMRAGQIIEITPQGKVVWKYTAQGEGGLDHPSLAIELPNGNILANDDMNDRVIVIDKASKKIVWQYGVTHQPGRSAGHLSIPDGLDIEKASP